MLLRRVIEHVQAQNWTAIALDFVIVVVGVYTAVWIEGLREEAETRKRTAHIVATLRQDLRDSMRVESEFNAAIAAGLAQWQRDFDAGRTPPPYYFRIPGSDTPPPTTWDALMQMRLGDFLDPALVFELGLYYAERDGVGRKYLRYVSFVEDEILPRMYGDSSAFYVADGSRLQPEFAASMDRLRDWSFEVRVTMEMAKCLDERLDAPGVSGASCAPLWDLSRSGPAAVAGGAAQ